MVKCGSQLNSALVALVLMAVVQYGSAAEKLATCCKTVNRQELTEPITGYLVQKANHDCVNAVIFQTESGLFCSYVKAPWVLPKIRAFEKAKAQAAAAASSVIPTSPVSLLSLITSTASTPPSTISPSTIPPSTIPPSTISPSTIPPSSSLQSIRSTFETDLPFGESISENDFE